MVLPDARIVPSSSLQDRIITGSATVGNRRECTLPPICLTGAHDDLGVAEEVRNAIVEEWAAEYERRADKWMSGLATDC